MSSTEHQDVENPGSNASMPRVQQQKDEVDADFGQSKSTTAAQLSDDPAGNWLTNPRSTLLVVLTLITTLSFQLGVNPPGGFWQDDFAGEFKSGAVIQKPHRAGNAIMRDKHPNRYLAFAIASWLCFYESLLLIMFLLTGTSLKSPWFRGLFLFCIATLVFLFPVSHFEDRIVVAFVTAMGVMAWGGYIIFFKTSSYRRDYNP